MNNIRRFGSVRLGPLQSKYPPSETDALPFAELLKRGSDDTPALHHTVSAHPDISQVASDDAVIHDNSLEDRTHTQFKLYHSLIRDSNITTRTERKLYNSLSSRCVFVSSLLCHWGRCFDSHTALTVCSLCCQKPEIFKKRRHEWLVIILKCVSVFSVYLNWAQTMISAVQRPTPRPASVSQIASD